MGTQTDAAARMEEASENDPAGGLIVEHYRVDATRRLWHALGWGAAITTVGSLVVAFALVTAQMGDGRPLRSRALLVRPGAAVVRGPAVTAEGEPIGDGPSWPEVVAGLVGLGCIVVGGSWAIVRLKEVLSEEAYLALRTDGVYFRRGSTRSLVRWDDVESVRYEGSRREVVFALLDGSEWSRAERYAGIDGERLAERAADVRRKALFGLLPGA